MSEDKENNSGFTERFLSCLKQEGVEYAPGTRTGSLTKWCNDNGLDYRIIHRLASKWGHVPTWKTLVKLSKIFAVSVDWLLTGEPPTEKVFEYRLIEDPVYRKYILKKIELEETLEKKELELEELKKMKDSLADNVERFNNPNKKQ